MHKPTNVKTLKMKSEKSVIGRRQRVYELISKPYTP